MVRREEDLFVVTTERGDIRCRRAKSCLVAPDVGDTVLVATATTGRAWMLAVLEGEGSGKTRLEAEGDLDVTLSNGAFTVACPEVNVLSGRFNVNALDGNIAFSAACVRGALLVERGGEDSFARRVVGQRARTPQSKSEALLPHRR